jgi:hypothetical protein
MKPLDEDFNADYFRMEDYLRTESTSTPKQARGGVYSPADVPLIKRALDHYLRLDLSDTEINQVANLLHRLNNRI